jgi:hypothetical protein
MAHRKLSIKIIAEFVKRNNSTSMSGMGYIYCWKRDPIFEGIGHRRGLHM